MASNPPSQPQPRRTWTSPTTFSAHSPCPYPSSSLPDHTTIASRRSPRLPRHRRRQTALGSPRQPAVVVPPPPPAPARLRPTSSVRSSKWASRLNRHARRSHALHPASTSRRRSSFWSERTTTTKTNSWLASSRPASAPRSATRTTTTRRTLPPRAGVNHRSRAPSATRTRRRQTGSTRPTSCTRRHPRSARPFSPRPPPSGRLPRHRRKRRSRSIIAPEPSAALRLPTPAASVIVRAGGATPPPLRQRVKNGRESQSGWSRPNSHSPTTRLPPPAPTSQQSWAEGSRTRTTRTRLLPPRLPRGPARARRVRRLHLRPRAWLRLRLRRPCRRLPVRSSARDATRLHPSRGSTVRRAHRRSCPRGLLRHPRRRMRLPTVAVPRAVPLLRLRPPPHSSAVRSRARRRTPSRRPRATRTRATTISGGAPMRMPKRATRAALQLSNRARLIRFGWCLC